jgi:hypothetical protein
MQLQFEDIVDRHKDTPAIIAVHGPSLNKDKEALIRKQTEENWVRFSVNNWYEVFDIPPDYWVLSTTFYTIERMVDIINKAKTTVLYSDDGDFTPKDYIEKNLEPDWLVYDQRHWEGKSCIEVLNSFNEYHDKNKDFNFSRYGNNTAMWQPPRRRGNFGHCFTNDKCCRQNNPARETIQECLQRISRYSQHYSTGDTITIHAVSFAILMGCNPIYISGLDLDYEKGHMALDTVDSGARAEGKHSWFDCSTNLKNDLEILNGSAKNLGIDIINLHPDPWYGVFGTGEIDT